MVQNATGLAVDDLVGAKNGGVDGEAEAPFPQSTDSAVAIDVVSQVNVVVAGQKVSEDFDA